MVAPFSVSEGLDTACCKIDLIPMDSIGGECKSAFVHLAAPAMSEVEWSVNSLNASAPLDFSRRMPPGASEPLALASLRETGFPYDYGQNTMDRGNLQGRIDNLHLTINPG